MAKPDKDYRTSSIKIMLTSAEKVRWREKATLSGLPISELVRSSVEDLTVVSQENRQAVEALRREINRIGNNLNQIARWANTYKCEAEAEEIRDQLEAIAQFCQKLREKRC